MAKKKLITLTKELDFTTETEYFDYMIDTHINGQFTQCRNLFNEMKLVDQKRLISYISTYSKLHDVYVFYFDLL